MGVLAQLERPQVGFVGGGCGVSVSACVAAGSGQGVIRRTSMSG